MPTMRKTAIAARMAQPWRTSPTARPKASTEAVGISNRAQISRKLVQAFGFSNGCAELALKKPPPLVPSSLMISWLAIGPIEMVCFAPSNVVASTAPARVLRHAESNKDEGPDERHGQEEVEADAGDIDPEIADGRGRGAHEPA